MVDFTNLTVGQARHLSQSLEEAIRISDRKGISGIERVEFIGLYIAANARNFRAEREANSVIEKARGVQRHG